MLTRYESCEVIDDDEPAGAAEAPAARSPYVSMPKPRLPAAAGRSAGQLRKVVQAIIAVRKFRRGPGAAEADRRSAAKRAAKDIDLDLGRTMAGCPLVTAHRGWIRGMLVRHAAEDPELGYCQGMNQVAAIFAVVADTEEEAYQRFRAFVKPVRGLWLPGFPLLQEAVETFEATVQVRRWFQHLQARGVETHLYLPRALLSMFTVWLPLDTMRSCLGRLERGGLRGMVATAVAVLNHSAPQLLQLKDMDELLARLQSPCEAAPGPRVLALRTTVALPLVTVAASLAEEWRKGPLTYLGIAEDWRKRPTSCLAPRCESSA